MKKGFNNVSNWTDVNLLQGQGW